MTKRCGRMRISPVCASRTRNSLPARTASSTTHRSGESRWNIFRASIGKRVTSEPERVGKRTQAKVRRFTRARRPHVPQLRSPLRQPLRAFRARHEQCRDAENGEMNRHDVLSCRDGNQSRQQRIPLLRRLELHLPGARELVVLSRGTLLGIRNLLPLPAGADQIVALQAPHRGIHRSTGQAGHFHHAESVHVAGVDGLENHRRGMGEFRLGRHTGSIAM